MLTVSFTPSDYSSLIYMGSTTVNHTYGDITSTNFKHDHYVSLNNAEVVTRVRPTFEIIAL